MFSERTRSGAYWGDRGLAPPLARPEDPAPLGGLLADALGAGLRALELLLLNLYLAVQVYLILFVLTYCAGAAPHLYLAVQVFLILFVLIYCAGAASQPLPRRAGVPTSTRRRRRCVR